MTADLFASAPPRRGGLDPTTPIAERVRLHNSHWGDTLHYQLSGDRFYGQWMAGQRFAGSGYFGAYDPTFLRRVLALFPDAADVLHLFSGSVSPNEHPPGYLVYTVDINPHNEPTWCGDAQQLDKVIPRALLDPSDPTGPRRHRQFDLIIADPPWTREYARRYGYPMIVRPKVVRQCEQFVRDGGFLIWHDVQVPIFSARSWRWAGTAYIFRSTNMLTRTVSFLQRR